jgi:hypothetical protein
MLDEGEMGSGTFSSSFSGLRSLLTMGLFLALGLVSFTASAQSDDIVTPDPLQFDLYKQGADAYKGQEYQKAIEFFEASLVIGPLNITYLTLGRSFFKTGQCDKASEAYAKARSAPKIASPTPMQVLGKIEEYVAELPGACPAYLKLTCVPADLEVYVDGQGPSSCDETIALLPGKHTVRVERDGEFEEQKVDVAGMDKLRLKFDLAAVLTPGLKVDEVDTDAPSLVRPLSDILVDVGFGLMAAGTVDIASNNGQVIQPTHDESSSVTVDVAGAYRLFKGLYLGIRVGLVADYEVNDPTQTPVRVFPIKGTQTELNLFSRYMFPIGDLLLYLGLDGGVSMLSPEGGFESLVGVNVGLTPGIAWRFSDNVAIMLDSRASFYNMSSTVVEDVGADNRSGIRDAEFSNGSRVSFNLRVAFGF